MAISTEKGTGFIGIHQAYWHKSSLTERHQILFHEMFHVLDYYTARILNIYTVQMKHYQTIFHAMLHIDDIIQSQEAIRERHIGEVLAEIAAKDFGNYSQEDLFSNAVSDKNETPDERGHLTKIETLYTMHIWRRKKSELKLLTCGSITDYYEDTALALRDFCVEYVDNRKDHIKKASNFVRAESACRKGFFVRLLHFFEYSVHTRTKREKKAAS